MTEKMKAMLVQLDALRSELVSTLTDRQYEALRRFEECYDNVSAASERDVFTYAFKLGARMGLEIADKKIE